MIDMISNYEKAKISMARVSLQYDQAAMIHIAGKQKMVAIWLMNL